jgi:hypothetical protein
VNNLLIIIIIFVPFKERNLDLEVVRIVLAELEILVIAAEIRSERKNPDGRRQMTEQKERHLFLEVRWFKGLYLFIFFKK